MIASDDDGVWSGARFAPAPAGTVTLEHTRIGDAIRSIHGRTCFVRDVRRRDVAVGAADGVLVRRQALDRTRPFRDVLLGPGQRVMVDDEHRFPVSMLLNGVSVRHWAWPAATAAITPVVEDDLVVSVDGLHVVLGSSGSETLDLSAIASLWARVAQRAEQLPWLFAHPPTLPHGPEVTGHRSLAVELE